MEGLNSDEITKKKVENTRKTKQKKKNKPRRRMELEEKRTAKGTVKLRLSIALHRILCSTLNKKRSLFLKKKKRKKKKKKKMLRQKRKKGSSTSPSFSFHEHPLEKKQKIGGPSLLPSVIIHHDKVLASFASFLTFSEMIILSLVIRSVLNFVPILNITCRREYDAISSLNLSFPRVTSIRLFGQDVQRYFSILSKQFPHLFYIEASKGSPEIVQIQQPLLSVRISSSSILSIQNDFSKLETLSIYQASLPILDAFDPCSSLKTLELDTQLIDLECLQRFTSLPSLTSCYFKDVQTFPCSYIPFQNPNLQYLSVVSSGASSLRVLIYYSKQLVSLCVANLDSVECLDQQEDWFQFPLLQQLSIQNCEHSPVDKILTSCSTTLRLLEINKIEHMDLYNYCKLQRLSLLPSNNTELLSLRLPRNQSLLSLHFEYASPHLLFDACHWNQLVQLGLPVTHGITYSTRHPCSIDNIVRILKASEQQLQDLTLYFEPATVSLTISESLSIRTSLGFLRKLDTLSFYNLNHTSFPFHLPPGLCHLRYFALQRGCRYHEAHLYDLQELRIFTDVTQHHTSALLSISNCPKLNTIDLNEMGGMIFSGQFTLYTNFLPLLSRILPPLHFSRED